MFRSFITFSFTIAICMGSSLVCAQSSTRGRAPSASSGSGTRSAPAVRSRSVTRSAPAARAGSTTRSTQAGSSTRSATSAGSGTRSASKLGLSGYCPVCVVEMKAWEKGSPALTSTYDAVTYRFPSAEIKAKFDANPQAYVPVLGGDCVVCYAKMNSRVPGSVNHSSLFGGRLYLFPSDKEKRIFESDPEAFADADLAANGNCVVCLAKMGKQVSGSPEHTVIFGGMRYQFPSVNEASLFMQSPQQFAQVAN